MKIFPINHALLLQITNHHLIYRLVGYALRNRPHVWLAWSEIAKWPLLGFIVPRIAVLVDMTSPVKGLRTLVQAINMVKETSMGSDYFP